MASKYLGRMAHDKYFLTALCKDERIQSANVKGSVQLQELANKALKDIERRQVWSQITIITAITRCCTRIFLY